MDEPIPPTSSTLGWRREGFEVALIGPEAMRHRELLLRAGYRVRGALQGDRAQRVFADDVAVDVIVLDFALEGRPPEAVLLFSRGTSAAAALVALVPAQDSDGFRRAFMAGARDVLPTPSRGEDLLASVDYLLEPRALQSTVDRLRQQLGADETIALPPSKPSADDKAAVIALEAQVAELRREIERLREKHDKQQQQSATRLQQQVMLVVGERDRALASLEQAKQKARSFRREALDGQGQLRLLERACEELQLKLKDARDQRRAVESRLVEAQKRTRTLEQVIHQHVQAAELEVQSAQALLEVPRSDVDPEAALLEREQDERRLAELEGAMKERDDLERRVKELELELAKVSETSTRSAAAADGFGSERTRAEIDTASELEAALAARAEDERRLAELDGVLVERERLDAEVRRLQQALSEESVDPRTAELEAELRDLADAHGETTAMLEAVRVDRESLSRRLAELEREAADAVMRVEELAPLVGEVERLRAELRAERDARQHALRNTAQLTTQSSALDRETTTLAWELEAKQRRLVLAYARQEVLSGELAKLREQMAAETRSREALLEKLRAAEEELGRLRSAFGASSLKRVVT